MAVTQAQEAAAALQQERDRATRAEAQLEQGRREREELGKVLSSKLCHNQNSARA